MQVEIKPSDLFYKYQRKKENLEVPKFSGKPDPEFFDRDDLYEILPMFEAVMSTIETTDGEILQKLEEILIYELPRSISSREDVFDCLVDSGRAILGR